MENQHREIKGYRDLNPGEVALMNKIKEKGAELGGLVDALYALPEIDNRWVSIGQTQIQLGLMALTRSVAKPNLF